VAYITQYLDLLDEVYALNSLTTGFEAGNDMIRNTSNAQTVEIQNIAVEGLSDYDQTNGYAASAATVSWQALRLLKDRGAKFSIDAIDVMEAYLSAAKVQGQFMRTKVIPEIDLYRFTKIAAGAASYTTTTATADNAVELVDTGIAVLQDANVDMSSVLMYASPSFYKLLKQSSDLVRLVGSTQQVNNINRQITMFDDMPVTVIPKSRFSTTATFGAKTNTQTGRYIDFALVDKNSVVAIKKHEQPKIILPQDNQSTDGFLVFYRIYHDCFVFTNKTAGIYYNAGVAL
jgi:hypothetical protein